MKKRPNSLSLSVISLLVLLTGCQTYENLPAMADHVDMDRFMGTWYVHGYTPTFLDRHAYNATESYELDDKNQILTTYQFRDGSFDGKLKVMHPVGRVFNEETNSEWRMRFFKVFSAPYLILYVDQQYEYTLVGHPNLKMAWLMSRFPEIEDTKYDQLVEQLKARSFDLEAFVRLPQQWPTP